MLTVLFFGFNKFTRLLADFGTADGIDTTGGFVLGAGLAWTCLRRVVIRILLWERADDGLVLNGSAVRNDPCRSKRLHGGDMQGGFLRWDELGEEKHEGGCESFVGRCISCRGVRGGDFAVRCERSVRCMSGWVWVSAQWTMILRRYGVLQRRRQ